MNEKKTASLGKAEMKAALETVKQYADTHALKPAKGYRQWSKLLTDCQTASDDLYREIWASLPDDRLREMFAAYRALEKRENYYAPEWQKILRGWLKIARKYIAAARRSKGDGQP